MRYQPSVATMKADQPEVEEQLGPEMCVFGFEADLE